MKNERKTMNENQKPEQISELDSNALLAKMTDGCELNNYGCGWFCSEERRAYTSVQNWPVEDETVQELVDQGQLKYVDQTRRKWATKNQALQPPLCVRFVRNF